MGGGVLLESNACRIGPLINHSSWLDFISSLEMGLDSTKDEKNLEEVIKKYQRRRILILKQY